MPDPELTRLLTDDPALGRAIVFDLLARGPRIRPSRALLIDPDELVWQRWQRRVAAAAALLSSPAVEPVVAELLDELAASPELAADVARVVQPWRGLAAGDRAAVVAVLRRSA